MAQIYRRASGRKMEQLIALHATVQNRLDTEILEAAGRAEAKLAAHHDQGHAKIEVEEGRVDRYLVLSDERGYGAAMSIELGHNTEGRDGVAKHVAGLFIISDALGVKRRRG